MQYAWRTPANSMQAVQTLGRAVNLWEKFVRDYPKVPEFQQDLALLHLITGMNLNAPALRSLALPSLEKSRDLLETLVRENPAQPDHKELLANAYGYMGHMMMLEKRFSEGIESYDKGTQLLEQLITQFPAVWRYRDRLWDMHRRAERSLSNRGQVEEAEKAARRGATVLEKLVAEFPTESRYRNELAEVNSRLSARSHARPAKDTVEAESLVVAAKNCPVFLQRMWWDKKWSNDCQQFVRSQRGGFVELELPALQGPVALAVCFTKAPDYAIVEVTVDGEVVGQTFDGYDPEIVPSGQIDFGILEPKDRKHKIRFTAIDKNANSSDYFMGIDCLVLKPVEENK